jgi:signal transduction histidine kinase
MQNKMIQAYINVTESSHNLRKSYKRHLQSDELNALSELAASFAHEVNNPLTGVLLYTRLLYKKISNGEISKVLALDYLSKIDSELTRTTGMIRDLKDFARQSNPTFRELDINVVIEQILDSITKYIDLHRIQVSRELDGALPQVNGDLEQLQRVFTNLILNAVQAMPGGGVLVIRSGSREDQLKVEIQDSGCGISRENLRKVFTPFFSTKPEVKGVGLGLAVAYGITKRHGGNIEVRSEVGQGSIFTVNLPVRKRPMEMLDRIESESSHQPSPT